jgi:hypothetical protein
MTLLEAVAKITALATSSKKRSSSATIDAEQDQIMALAALIPGLAPMVQERRQPSERRVAKDVPGSPSRRLGQRRLVSFQITVTV